MAIYFDTNSLRAAGWPHASASLSNLGELAKYVRAELFVPEPVETELEALWLRDFESKRASIAAKIADLEKHSADVALLGLHVTVPPERDLSAAFRKAADATKARLGLVTIPMTTRPLREFFEMAVNRRAPFGDRDKGFRDAAIFWSSVDHAVAAKADRCALVSADAALTAEELLERAQAEGVKVRIYDSVNAIADVLQSMLKEGLRLVAVEEQERARAALEAAREEVAKAVLPAMTLTSSDAARLSGTVRRFDRPELGTIEHVRTPFPPVAGPVAISFDAEVRLHVVVHRYPFPAWEIPPGEEVPMAFGFVTVPVQAEQVITKRVDVEATAVRTAQGEYKDVKIIGVRPKLEGTLRDLTAADVNLGDLADLANS